MPIYDYRCSDCNKTFELFLRNTTLPSCPDCGSRKIEKQISLPAPQGKIAGIISGARAQAAKEGHFSHYNSAEISRSNKSKFGN